MKYQTSGTGQFHSAIDRTSSLWNMGEDRIFSVQRCVQRQNIIAYFTNFPD